MLKLIWKRPDKFAKMSMLQCLPNCLVGVLFEWIKIHSKCSGEDDRVLKIENNDNKKYDRDVRLIKLKTNDSLNQLIKGKSVND